MLLKVDVQIARMQLRFCHYDLFLQKQTANSYIVEVWLEQRRRDSNPLNSES